MWVSISPRHGGMEVEVQPKEGSAFQRSWLSRGPTGPVNLGHQRGPPRAASSSCRGEMGVSTSVTDSMSFSSKVRRIERLSVYRIGNKYIKCTFSNKYVCASVWTWRWLVSSCHFYNRQTFLGAITRTGWCFCSLCCLKKKHFSEHRIGVGLVPQTLAEGR